LVFATTFEYDERDRVIAETNELGNTRSFEYDNVGNRIAMIDRNGRVREFVYPSSVSLRREKPIDFFESFSGCAIALRAPNRRFDRCTFSSEKLSQDAKNAKIVV